MYLNPHKFHYSRKIDITLNLRGPHWVKVKRYLLIPTNFIITENHTGTVAAYPADAKSFLKHYKCVGGILSTGLGM